MAKQQSAPVGDVVFTVDVPVRKATHAYKSNHVDVQLNRNESDRLADVYSGLLREGATIRGGKPVSTPNMVLIWILENLQRKEA